MKKRIWIVISVIVILSIGSVAMALNRTEYRQQEDCFLCIRRKGQSKSLYNDGVGILNLNDFSISTLRICNEEPNMSMSGSSHTTNANGENGSIISIDSNLSRRIADVTITLREESKPNPKDMARFLCADCCKQIEQENKYDVAFFDYQTKEIFPVKESTIEFYIGDYAIHKLNSGDDLEYLIFYAPEQ